MTKYYNIFIKTDILCVKLTSLNSKKILILYIFFNFFELKKAKRQNAFKSTTLTRLRINISILDLTLCN